MVNDRRLTGEANSELEFAVLWLQGAESAVIWLEMKHFSKLAACLAGPVDLRGAGPGVFRGG